MKTKQKWIEDLALISHVEGGWYSQHYTSDYTIKNKNDEDRPSATSIHFLLDDTDFSALHRLQADEIWYHQYGSAFHIIAIDLEGNLHDFLLGNNIAAGENLQVTVPKGWIFGSYVEKDYGIAGCMVTPGFSYEDFELFTAADLIAKYPQHKTMIKKMTRQ